MAGKNLLSRAHRSPSSSSLFSPATSAAILSVLSLLAFFYLYPSASSRHQSPDSSSSTQLFRKPNPAAVDTSFLVSLEKFLLNSRAYDRVDSSDGGAGAGAAAKALDDRIWRREMQGLYEDPVAPVLHVYVYDMPAKFTYDLLWLFRNTYKDTDNLTSNGSPVHRLIEQVLRLCRWKSLDFETLDVLASKTVNYLSLMMHWLENVVYYVFFIFIFFFFFFFRKY